MFQYHEYRNQRVKALDKHQTWSVSALFHHISWAQSKYANQIHAWYKQTFCFFRYDILLACSMKNTSRSQDR